MQEEGPYQGYQSCYDKQAEDIHKRDLEGDAYLEMSLFHKLRYHLWHPSRAMRLWRRTRKDIKRWIISKEFIGPTAQLTILDIGAGEGRLLCQFEGSRVAFDIAPSQLRYAIERGLPCVAGFAERLPFKSRAFDLVICAAVLEHVLSPEEIAGEIHRVLRPGGRLIVETPFNEAPERLFEVQEGSAGLTIERTLPKEASRPPTLHLRNFTRIEEFDALFPTLRRARVNPYFYKRRRTFPRGLKMLLRPFRWMPDPVKTYLPQLFVPSMVQVEFTKPR